MPNIETIPINESGRSTKIQETSALLDNYISVLAHDLRNPLATARMSSEIILQLSKKNDLLARHSGIIKSSSYRMEAMIQNILDFARCQMNLGIELQKEESFDGLEKVMEQVIKEMRIISPDRKLKFEVSLESPVSCDSVRLGQLLSNLLANADAQAIPETPISIILRSKAEELSLTLSYKGNKISQSDISRLFNPFHQEEPMKKGTGLALYIASEIAKAHNGSIEVTSNRQKTSFIFRMKCG